MVIPQKETAVAERGRSQRKATEYGHNVVENTKRDGKRHRGRVEIYDDKLEKKWYNKKIARDRRDDKMAASSGRKTSSSNKKTSVSAAKGTGKSRTSAQKKKAEAQQRAQDSALFHEIGLIVLFAVMALLFCCNFGLIGPAGNTVSGVLFGIFGLTAYVAPLLLFLAAAFWFANEGNPNALRKLIAGIILFVMLGVLCDLFSGHEETEAAEAEFQVLLLYEGCRDKKAGGGILGGSIGFLLRNYLGVIGAVLVVLVCSVVCLILLTEKSLLDSLKQGGSRVRELSREDFERRRESAERRREDAERRREQSRIKRQEQEEERARREEARRLREEEMENEKILRMERKVSGVMFDATLPKPEKVLPHDDMHEIILPEEAVIEESLQQSRVEIIEQTGEKKEIRKQTEKQITERQKVETQVFEQKQTVKEERSSAAEGEMSPAFEQWDMPDLPIRIHKEGMEEADAPAGQVSMIQEETGMYGQGTTIPEGVGYGQESALPEGIEYGQEPALPEGIGYGQEPALPEGIEYGQEPALPEGIEYGQEAAIPEGIGGYGQEPVLPEHRDSHGQGALDGQSAAMSGDSGSHGKFMMPGDISTYGEDFMAQEDIGAYGQDLTGTENIGVYDQNTGLRDTAGSYEQNGAMQNSVKSCEQTAGLPEGTRADEQSSNIQNGIGGREQDSPANSLPTSAAAGAFRPNPVNPVIGAEANSTVNAASVTGASRPTVAVKPTGVPVNRIPMEGVPANRISMEGMPAAGGTQSMTANGKEAKVPKQYMFPPITLLQKGVTITGDSVRELKETAVHLQQTLSTFGVKVTITDISQGPSVTRYELQPEQGVKVSKIVSLTDDIKLNLAAMDIRIEAPIPGKAAIGIEVPNKESIPVALRDLLETEEFRNFPSNLAFAVGKDIAGKVVVADIAKMPHMLIAGATGSGKSVCINTLIMGILYKAHPDDVKLIMVDPKVVELSVYNGIPHLLIPVVTDPKKASAALHWGVAEMEDRYRKFAEWNVRDLKGYNKKVEAQQEKGDQNAPKKLPQIVIIVDELADLMMVCPGEVEESICRLAQLARAAGIHLIIATQRPSVDVITGLIKANMPSRVAFSVSSGVDSRTILDMVGAEKLLGKGDMLFYPQGYAKPARVQGAFVSDNEVSDVVDFMKNQTLGNTYAEEIEEKIKNMGSSSGGVSGSSEVDDLFEKAGRLIIDKDKASIGMLQRALQIGFNRAARIMDQLCSYGVVGEEEGTKPRKILMSPEQFEQLLEEV